MKKKSVGNRKRGKLTGRRVKATGAARPQEWGAPHGTPAGGATRRVGGGS